MKSLTVVQFREIDIADAGNNAVRMVSASTGLITTVAGLNIPGGVVVDGTGSLYILEAEGVRFVDSTDTQTTPLDFGAVQPPTQGT